VNIQAILEAKGSADVFIMDENSTIRDFIAEACRREVGAMLVTNEEGELTGIVTERDVIRQANELGDFKRTLLADIMTRDVVFVQVLDDIQTAMDYMVSLRIRHLPVLSGTDISGLITIRDIVLALRLADDKETRLFVEYLQKSLKEKEGK